MTILVDMNLSPRWVSLLKKAGIQSYHWSSLGFATATDKEILSCAKLNRYVILTYDLDFGAILASCRFQFPSVIQIRARNLDSLKLAQKVIAVIKKHEAFLNQGCLISIDDKKNKLRILPIADSRKTQK